MRCIITMSLAKSANSSGLAMALPPNFTTTTRASEPLDVRQRLEDDVDRDGGVAPRVDDGLVGA